MAATAPKTTPAEDRPDTPSSVYKAMLADVQRCRHVSGGTSSLREHDRTYLPQHPAETSADYNIRLQRSVFFNAFKRTIRGLSGMVFRRDPSLNEDVPQQIQEHLEDVNQQGSHFDVFAKQVFEDAIEAGHCAVLIDAPKAVVPDGQSALTLAQEQEQGLRPRWIHVLKEDIISWRTELVGGVEILRQVVLHETAEQPKGKFESETIHRYRVLRNNAGEITYEVWQKQDDEVFLTEDQGTIMNIDTIPLVPVYANQTGFLTSDPPLLDLAYTNISHYQVQSDHLHALHLASIPIFVITGIDPKEEIKISPNAAIKISNTDANAFYAEHSGAALQATRQQMQDYKTDMATLGLAMLQHETRAAETAEAKRIDKAEQDSALASAARGLQDALETALTYHAQLMRVDTGGSVTINRDFERLTLDANEVNSYSNLVAKNQLSLETMWAILAEGGVLPDQFDPEIERANIDDAALLDLGERDLTEDAKPE